MDFPAISPELDASEIYTLARSFCKQIRDLISKNPDQLNAVHVMGELTFSFALVAILQKNNITCMASTSERKTTENPDGSKTIHFNFVRFREYPQLQLLK
jgi:hypothetical protein